MESLWEAKPAAIPGHCDGGYRSRWLKAGVLSHALYSGVFSTAYSLNVVRSSLIDFTLKSITTETADSK